MWLVRRIITIVYWRRSHIIQVFIFGQTCFWRHDISRSDQPEHCLHAVMAKHSVCLQVNRAVSRLWPSDVWNIVWYWTLIDQSRIYFSPLQLIWLQFIRLCINSVRKISFCIFKMWLRDSHRKNAYHAPGGWVKGSSAQSFTTPEST